MSHCDIDFRPVELTFVVHHLFKLCTKFERNRTVLGQVLDEVD